MTNIYLLIAASLVAWYFFSLRKYAELAQQYAMQYCEKHELQFIALSRISTQLGASKRLGIFIKTNYALEFSSDGESSYTGELSMQGLKLAEIILPPYRLN